MPQPVIFGLPLSTWLSIAVFLIGAILAVLKIAPTEFLMNMIGVLEHAAEPEALLPLLLDLIKDEGVFKMTKREKRRIKELSLDEEGSTEAGALTTEGL